MDCRVERANTCLDVNSVNTGLLSLDIYRRPVRSAEGVRGGYCILFMLKHSQHFFKIKIGKPTQHQPRGWFKTNEMDFLFQPSLRGPVPT